MPVHPDIAALRGDRAPQRQAQEAILVARADWAAEPGAQALLDDLAAYGAGAPLEACNQLARVFTGQGEGERLMGLLSRYYCRAIKANPIGHPPFRAGFNGMATSILLASAGRAQLMIQAREPGQDDSTRLAFTHAVRHDAVLAGEARGRIVRMLGAHDGAAQFDCETLPLGPGHRLAFDLASEGLLVEAVERRFVVLRLVRFAAEPQPTREYCLASGRLLQQSAGQIGTSRQEASIALLGRMRRADAAPEFVRVATGEGDASLRWQALREALALDTASGFRALLQVARRDEDPLAAQAGALRAQLLESYPELGQLEDLPCLA
jgi:hypothetical protein